MSVAWAQTVTPWTATGTSVASASFTPTAGDGLIIYGADGTNSGKTLGFSGTGTYTIDVNSFSDGDLDTHEAGHQLNCSGAAQTASITSLTSDILAGWLWEYSGVNSVNNVGIVLVNAPGGGSGAIQGTAVTVASGDILLALCLCVNGSPALSSPSGTSRGNGNNNFVYQATEYAGAGSSITPSFTASDGTKHFTVAQWTLSASAAANILMGQAWM